MIDIRVEAMRRFQAQPTKCFQRHIREVYGEVEHREQLTSLTDARVIRIPNEDAAAIIRRYEWLNSMAAGTIASYGLMLQGELLGAVCFSKGASHEALRAICPDPSKAILLARGCCLPHAPKDAASNLIRYATKMAHKQFGWTHFMGYSDEQAGEVGTIYKACNWNCIGRSQQGTKTSFIAPDGTRISSYNFNKKSEQKFYDLGWDGAEKKYDFLRRIGCTEQVEAQKNRWLWREGPYSRPHRRNVAA
jgi:hypothetical protein